MSEADGKARVLSREPIYDGRVVKLRCEEIELPGGRRSRLEIVAHPGAAAIVPLDGDDRVLLVSDSYHNRRLKGIARELGLEPFVAPTDDDPSAGQLVGETGRVAVGELIGYRRLFNQTR